MRKIFRKTKRRLSLPVSEADAADIAREICSLKPESFSVHSSMPPRAAVYGCPREPSWYVVVTRDDERRGQIFGSSRLIIISRQTGEVLYDGSANDEG